MATETHKEFLERIRKEGIEVIFARASPISSPEAHYPGFYPDPGIILPKGTVCLEGALPLPCDIVYESDVPVTMRDGTIIYTDVFRPTGVNKVPAIVAWSPYGKKMSNEVRMGGARAMGVQSPLSGLEKSESPDPAYWCNQGYAVINPDARGAFNSQGDIHFWGSQEAEDGHDLIEWVAAQDWCNGKVGMSGNSWLAICQWFMAALRPPHLAAIAPWEGFADMYRDSLAEGGIPDPFWGMFLKVAFFGHNRAEDIMAMIAKYPLMNSYWHDKAAKLDRIEIPAYVVASWSNFVHTPGTIAAFRQIPSKDKWLRVHNTMEFTDQYSPEGREDLHRFFDRYLRGIQNGWERTPRVRLSILDPGGTDEVNRPESEFPLARTQYRKLFLDAEEGKLSFNPVTQGATTSYKADDGRASFTMQFDQAQELTGYMKLHLWVETKGSDDMDLFVAVQKLDKMGRRMGHNSFSPYIPAVVLSNQLSYFISGPRGRLRVSHRQLDPARSTDSEPYLTHAVEELLSPGQVVPVEIPIRPISMRWRSGEQLRVVVAGYEVMGPPFPFLPPIPTRNKGEHIIHAGGKYDSHLLVPVIPH